MIQGDTVVINSYGYTWQMKNPDGSTIDILNMICMKKTDFKHGDVRILTPVASLCGSPPYMCSHLQQ